MRKFLITVVLLKSALVVSFLVLIGASSDIPLIDAQTAAAPTPQANYAIDRETSEPYIGELSIFEAPERDKNLQIDRVMDILKISPGKTVADIGAGSGWFTVRAAKRSGEKGRVFAVEINQGYIDHINNRAKTENLLNIKTILGKPEDPMLPAGSVDSVLILKTYHEIAEPIQFLKNLKKGLRMGGLVGIIDRNGNGSDHGLNKDKVVEEARRAGFKLVEEYDFVKPDGMDYFLVFQ